MVWCEKRILRVVTCVFFGACLLSFSGLETADGCRSTRCEVSERCVKTLVSAIAGSQTYVAPTAADLVIPIHLTLMVVNADNCNGDCGPVPSIVTTRLTPSVS